MEKRCCIIYIEKPWPGWPHSDPIVPSIFENGTWLCHIKINIQERGAAEHLEWLRGAKDARHASARQVHALDPSSGPTGPGSTVY